MDLQDPSVILGVLAGVIQLIGYAVYVRLSNGHANTGSWLIWTLSAGVDLYSYDHITQSDLVKEILPAACAVACVLTFAYLFAKRRVAMPDRSDWGLVVADCTVSLAWWQQITSAITANLLLQATTIISAWPMIRAMLQGRERESVAPWAIWATAYSLHTISVYMRLDHWSELAYPVANVIMHLAVMLVALKTQRFVR